ncbi:PaaI family thioesterase [Brucella haematophila]|nr:PaaI family thioesterase [Brucella haematophila]
MTTNTILNIDLAPFSIAAGMEVTFCNGREVEVVMPENPLLLNRRGVVHGGAIATLIDTTLGLAAGLEDGEGSALSATLNLNINYVSAGKGTLYCRSATQRRGRSIMHLEARVVDTEGTLVAFGMGTFKTVARR